MRLFICFVFVFLCSACTYEFDLNQPKCTEKPVLYAFPGNRDTLVIQFTKSVPVYSADSLLPAIRDARISVEIGGQTCQALWNEEATTSIPAQCYYVVRPISVGQRVFVRAVKDGFPELSAETSVPELIPMEEWRIDSIVTNNSKQICFQVGFRDPGGSRFYGLRIEKRVDVEVHNQEDGDYQYSYRTTEYCSLDDEPLLNEKNGLEGFLTENKKYDDNFYIWDNKTILGKKYMLKLSASPEYSIFNENYTSIVYYRIAFYTLSDAYFHYLERKNEILNNDLGDMGMAPNRPSYTNVKGGLGVVAGYQVQYTPWVRW